jgi:dihydropteroate synthase
MAISIDTTKPPVAEAALDAGADLINDVSALADPEMGPLLAARCCPVVLMHARGDLATMQRGIRFVDVVAEVRDEMAAARRRAESHGIAGDQIVLDPGIGFGKTASQNLALLAAVETLAALGAPLLVGASRKSFIAAAYAAPAPPSERLPGSLAAAAAAARGGAAILRVHDVAATRQFLTLAAAIAAAGVRGAGEGER